MLLFHRSSWGTCLAVSHSPTSVHSDFSSAGLHFYFPLSILYFLFLFALEVTFSCPSLVCLGVFEEGQGRRLLYFPCLQSTPTPSCLELLPLDAARAAPPLPWGKEWGAHESGHKGSIAIVSQLTIAIVSSLYFPQSQKEANPLLPHQGHCANSEATKSFPHPGRCRQDLSVQHCRGVQSVGTSFTD